MTTVLTEKQWDMVLTKIEEWNDAVEKGDRQKAMQIGRAVPYPPDVLKGMKDIYGKDYLIKRGFNLSLANKAFGKGWLDEP